MSAWQAVVSNARSSAHIAHALMSVTASTPTLVSAGAVEMALQSLDRFKTLWPYMILALRRSHRLDRKHIVEELSRLWSEAPDFWDVDSVRGLARVAHSCFDIGLTRRALQALRQLQAPTTHDLLLEAHCHAACGDLQQAIGLCRTVLERSPHNTQAASLHGGWTHRQQGWHAPWHVQVAGPDGLWLEPLHLDHGPALAWQYRDPAIAAKTLLPPLGHPLEASDWIDHRLSDRHIVPYALLHREHGFIGSAEITVSGTEGFLCIWIGTDWQGQGLGRRMVKMACEQAFRCGIETMLTAAYDDNKASLRVLRGCGFADVDIRAEAPDHDRTFLCLPSRPLASDEIVRRLIGFADRAETGLVFPMPASQSAAPDLQSQPIERKEEQ